MDFQQALQPLADVTNAAPTTEQGSLIDNAAPADTAAAAPAEAAPVSISPADAALNQQSQTQNNNEAATAPAPAATTPDFDFATLDPMSGGLIKDKGTFEAAIQRLKEVDALTETNKELSARMAAAPVFANDYVKTLNTLVQNGASVDQLKAFQKINELPELSEMSDRDARINRMIMIDGVKPSVAELKVDREFKLNDGLDDEEREILDEDLRLAANKDREALAQYKANLTQVGPPAEEIQLQQQTRLANHQAQVKPYVSEVMAGLPNLGVFNLSGKDGAEAVNYELPIDDATRSKLGQYVENYFIDGLTPVTPESTREALNYARAEYFRENADKLFKTVYEKGLTTGEERTVNRYENRSGLKPQVDNATIGNANPAAEMANFMAGVVNIK